MVRDRSPPCAWQQTLVPGGDADRGNQNRLNRQSPNSDSPGQISHCPLRRLHPRQVLAGLRKLVLWDTLAFLPELTQEFEGFGKVNFRPPSRVMMELAVVRQIHQLIARP